MSIAARRASFDLRVKQFGGPLNEPAVYAQFLAQVEHESGGFKHVKEIWGPTKAQRGYEGREDLGNTKPGDGMRFMGRDVIQTTGRANYRALTKWVRTSFKLNVDFEKTPEALEDPEWLGISAIWYFLVARKDLIRYCREGNNEMVTRRVNGGLNGYADRLKRYDAIALRMLGFKDVRSFQSACGLEVDGISGPKTRKAMHEALRGLLGVHTEHAPIEAPKKPAQRETAKPAAKKKETIKDGAAGLAGGLTAAALVLYAVATDALNKALEFYHWLTPWN